MTAFVDRLPEPTQAPLYDNRLGLVNVFSCGIVLFCRRLQCALTIDNSSPVGMINDSTAYVHAYADIVRQRWHSSPCASDILLCAQLFISRNCRRLAVISQLPPRMFISMGELVPRHTRKAGRSLEMRYNLHLALKSAFLPQAKECTEMFFLNSIEIGPARSTR